MGSLHSNRALIETGTEKGCEAMQWFLTEPLCWSIVHVFYCCCLFVFNKYKMHIRSFKHVAQWHSYF